MPLLFAFILFFTLFATLAAEEAFDPLSEFGAIEEDPLSGFEEFETAQTRTRASEPSALELSGNLAFKSSYGYRAHSVDGVEYSGVNQAQSALFLQLDYELSENWSARVSGDGFYDAYYSLSGKDFNKDVLKSYETQLRFDDVYVQGRVSKNLDVKLGRQIVVWGKSDSIRVTDVINPLDNRLPAMTDIKDLRLSTTMAKLDYYSGAWNFSAMLIAESRIFLEAAPRGEYFPVDAVFAGAPNPFIELKKPQDGFENFDTMQYAFAANGVFSGWDLSLYAADVLDSRWHIEGNLPNAKRVVSKVQMLGAAINIVQGSWLIKSEAAYFESLRYNSTKNSKNRLDALIGFDYMGVKDSVLSFEVANRHIFAYETRMSGQTAGVVPDYVQEDEFQSTIRVTRSFQNDSLKATVLLSMFGHNWEYGGFFRASLAYDVADGISANIGIIDYIDAQNIQERPFINAISNNDRLFIDITYSF